MNEPILIGLTGTMQSGKSTVAEYLEKNFSFMRYEMSYPLRKSIVKGLGLPDHILFDEKLKQTPVNEIIDSPITLTPREIMQQTGDYFRSIDPNCVVNSAKIAWNKFVSVYNLNSFNGMVISGIRMSDSGDLEPKMVRDLGGTIIHVKNSRAEKLLDNFNHTTELGVEIKPEDGLLLNEEGLDELYESVNSLLNEKFNINL